MNVFSRIKMLIKYNDLLRIIVTANLKEKYLGSVLGYFWSLLEPLLSMLIYLFVFSVIVKFKVENYSVFLLTGILSWNFLQISTTTGVTSLTRNFNLIRKVKMPRELFPLADVIARMIELLLSLIFLLLFITYYQISFTVNIFLFPLILFFQFLFIYGVCLFISHLNVLFTDVQRLQGVIMRLWFYLTPVIYPYSKVPAKIYHYYMLNPMAVFVSLYRTAFLGTPPPEAQYIIFAGVVTLLIYFSGMAFFLRNERIMLKFI